jgi:hypothetical protein
VATGSKTETNNVSYSNVNSSKPIVTEDDIDKALWAETWDLGSKVGINNVDNLKPDPWDQSFLKEKEIKFMSFHR